MQQPATDENGDQDPASGALQVPPRRDSALKRFVIWAFIGLAVGGVIALVALRQIHLDPTPGLTPQQFYAAHDAWKAHPVLDYDVEVRVTGPQAATYRVEVRRGEPQTATRNGQPLTSRRTFGTWSVPGMFSTISRDVEALERAADAGRPPPLILRAAFSERGVPEHYRRIDNGSRKGGDSIAVTWDVTEFHIVEPASSKAREPDSPQ
jgi:hypothetical protein